MFRYWMMILAALIVSACTNPDDLEEAPAYLGNFDLGHNVVVAPNLTKGPASREATKEEWIDEMKAAVDERFGRYDGENLYHLGISVEGYVLAIPGVPIVASPKSALILNVTAWDDSTQSKLNEKPELITVVESLSGPTILGSGLTQSKKKQMHNLTRNAAKQIESWLVKQNNEFGWFESDGRPAKEKLTILGSRIDGDQAEGAAAPESDDLLDNDESAAAEAGDAPADTAAAIEEPDAAALE
ncbi:hypothetical protein [Roseovarius aestuarii]|uniref:Uncharacterized protein n=1 Tax=Roseovarius aestuarii TaxID=475083 RepID=A0A1X7BPM4_9RHOB|nr:hypothetical protein [Roseovarius aestuarii]SMC11583.1 hypothetical protein ROA7745_01398 [Roseovarius aestuarii]